MNRKVCVFKLPLNTEQWFTKSVWMLMSLCGPRASAKPIGPIILYKTVRYCLCSARKDTREDTVFCYTQNQTLLWQQSSFFQKLRVSISGPFSAIKSTLSRGKKAKPTHILQTSWTTLFMGNLKSLFPFLVVKYVVRGVLFEIVPTYGDDDVWENILHLWTTLSDLSYFWTSK